jgi:hypothetical protein
METTQDPATRPARRPWIFILTPLLLISLSSACGETSTGILPADSVWTLVRPSVLWCSTSDSTATVEAHIVGRTDVISARLVGPNETFALYDDGTHGDVAAGDLVFTASEIRPYCHTGLTLKYGTTVGSWAGTLELTLADGRTLPDERPVRIGLVHPKYRAKIGTVVDYQNGLSATAYAFFIQDIDGAIFDGYPIAKAEADAASRRALAMVYSILPDAFDLAVVMPGMTLFHAGDMSTVSAQALRAANDVEHIGIPLFDNSRAYGSEGRLHGIILCPFGPVGLFDSEIAGLWGADLGLRLALSVVASDASVLWDPLSDVGGQLAATFVSEDSSSFGHLAANGDGTWRLVSPDENERYSPLELYAMGLLPAAEVPDAHVLSGVDLTDPERITASSTRTVTIDDIIAAQGGIRVPSAETSPKSFAVAFVVVQDAAFTDAEYAYYSLLSYALMRHEEPQNFDQFAPFYWATGGRGTLDTRLPIDVTPLVTP